MKTFRITAPQPTHGPGVAPKYRTFWPRFWAGNVDVALFYPLDPANEWIWKNVSDPMALVPWFIFYSIAFLTYSILCHGLLGQTLGKRLLGVRVLDVSENKLSMTQAVLRDAVGVLAGASSLIIDLPTVAAGQNPFDAATIAAEGFSPRMQIWMYVMLGWIVAEFVTMLFNNKRRAVHDYIARSVVVRTRLQEPLADAESVAE